MPPAADLRFEEHIRDLIGQQLGLDVAEVTAGASLVENLGADSLHIVELSMRLEEAIGANEVNDAAMERLEDERH